MVPARRAPGNGRHLASLERSAAATGSRTSAGGVLAFAAGCAGLAVATGCAEPASEATRAVAEPTSLASAAPKSSVAPREAASSTDTWRASNPPTGADARSARAHEPPGHRVEPAARADETMAAILAALRRRSAALLDDPEPRRLQILIAELEASGPTPRLVEHGYRVDAEYVYAASAVKPFVAAAALRSVDRLARRAGRPVTADTPLCFGVGRAFGCLESRDPSNREGGVITVRHEIRKMLLVSDNAAFGRLYDLVGHEGLYEALSSWGFDGVRIRHRMGGSEAEGRRAPAVELRAPGGPAIRLEPRESGVELAPTPARSLAVGQAHLDEAGRRRERPRDFGDRNYASVRDLQRLLVALVEPALAPDVHLDLPDAQRRWLVEVMGAVPTDSPNPRYAGARYAEAQFRPLLGGVLRVLPRAELDYVNKSGRAYGFLVENAYLRHRKTGRSLFVTVALYVDDDGVVNDDRYGYDELGTPLLEDLGEAVARLIR